ncbi:META domain-containing protein [Myroides pelagicus]|uniref:META domain-containing protein n=1 Tax=Myroides pelagicus TaxID=270914 RepID=UPI002DB749AA|nr:META domain-containing protein [Myroides pelagicus]MEC4114890.1 META domain-containing protein [Myroides pelagicus]
MKKTVLLLAAVLTIGFVSCNDKQKKEETATTEQVAETAKEEAKTTNTLEGSWELVSITSAGAEGKATDQLYPNKKPALTFEEEGKLYGNDGCNNLMGTFENKEANGLTIGDNLAGTKMFCEGVADALFTETLLSVTKYEIVDEQLVLTAGDVVVLTFKKSETAE